MAKKPDMTVVKDFLFKYGERVALFTCAGVALLLLVMGFSGATGPGTATGEPWEATLKKAQNPINSQLNRAVDQEAVDKAKKEYKVEPIDWRLVDSKATPGAYINGGEKFEIGRNNPVVFNPLRGDQNFQMDYLHRGYVGYDVQQKKILTVADGGATGGGATGQGGGVTGGLGPPKGSGGTGGVGPPGGIGGLQGGAGGPNLAHVLKPRHMLVVTGIYPMKKQVDEYVKALRLRDVNELIASKEMPFPAGFNVARLEIAPDGKPTTKEPALFIYYDIRKKSADALYVDPLLNKELAEAIIEEENPRRYRSIVHEGLATPLPKLPEGVSYPPVRIKGDYWPKPEELADNGDPSGAPGTPAAPGMPGPKGSGGKPPPILPPGGGSNKGGPMPPMGGGTTEEATPEIPTKQVPLTSIEKTNKELYTRLDKTHINIFHPFGQTPDTSDAAANTVERFGFHALLSGATGPAGGAPGGGMPQGGVPGGVGPPGGLKPGGGLGPTGGVGPPGGLKGGSGSFKPGAGGMPPPTDPATPTGPTTGIYDAIVRFVDLDVKPGYRYRYYIQVRFQNPNYGKKHDVAQQLFADMRELVADEEWTPTPEFTIPETYHLYAVDQFYQVDFMGEKDPQSIKKKMGQKDMKPADADHAIVQIHRWFGRTDYRIGDWAVVERLRVRKGEKIGGQEMIVEVPTWSDGKGAYEIRHTNPPAVKGKAAPKPLAGVPLDFVPMVTSPDGKRKDSVEPLLVDFEGGKKANAQLMGSGAPNDDAAMELLILTADGRLIVRNGRTDIDVVIDRDRPTEITRQQRVELWRKRNQDASGGGAAGNAMPGGPGTLGPKN
jgi:hypothetical protein